MESLVRVIYASTAVRPLSHPELLELLQHVRGINTELGVTGMLLHADGSFFQVLEGTPDAVGTLYSRIGRDPRHANVVLIVREAIPQRAFADWSMGFQSVTHAEVRDIVGVNDFFGFRLLLEDSTPGRARKLLDVFAQSRWRNRRAAA